MSSVLFAVVEDVEPLALALVEAPGRESIAGSTCGIGMKRPDDRSGLSRHIIDILPQSRDQECGEPLPRSENNPSQGYPNCVFERCTLSKRDTSIVYDNQASR